MTDLFEYKNIKPMLIKDNVPLFIDSAFIYEVKWDGERCIAYLDPNVGTDLRNKRNIKMLSKVPELSEIHRQIKKKCILDGELIIVKDGKPDFEAIRNRSLKTNSFKIKLESSQYPATFVAYDCLYYDTQSIMMLPLTARKKTLSKAIKTESGRLAVSRIYESDHAESLFKLTLQQDLEGIVAKRKDSLYFQDIRTKDWLKIKHLQDDDFVICGYIYKSNQMISLVLGQFAEGKLVYKGHVTLGVSRQAFSEIKEMSVIPSPPFDESVPVGNENAVWIQPKLVCVVKYMYKSKSGSMRQPVFKSLREDKPPEECIEKSSYD